MSKEHFEWLHGFPQSGDINDGHQASRTAFKHLKVNTIYSLTQPFQFATRKLGEVEKARRRV
jgi:hypothetical protein